MTEHVFTDEEGWEYTQDDLTQIAENRAACVFHDRRWEDCIGFSGEIPCMTQTELDRLADLEAKVEEAAAEALEALQVGQVTSPAQIAAMRDAAARIYRRRAADARKKRHLGGDEDGGGNGNAGAAGPKRV